MSEGEQRDATLAAQQSCAALADYAGALLRAVMARGGRELVARLESGLQAGGIATVRIGMLAGGCEVTLTVEGLADGPLELFSASGIVGEAAPPH